MTEKEINQSSCQEGTKRVSKGIQQHKQNINMERTAFHLYLFLMGNTCICLEVNFVNGHTEQLRL